MPDVPWSEKRCAFVCADSRVCSEARMTVQPDSPCGQLATPVVVPGVAEGVGVADGVAVALGVVVAVAPGLGVAVAPGLGVALAPGAALGAGVVVGTAVGAGVAAGGACATCVVSSASVTIASVTASAVRASSTPASAIGGRQPGAATTRAPTAAPQCRHHSWRSVSPAAQRGQRRPVGGGGVSTLLIRGAHASGAPRPA